MRKPTVVENIAALTDALGVIHAPIIWGLAHVDWPDHESRDEFTRLITKEQDANP